LDFAENLDEAALSLFFTLPAAACANGLTISMLKGQGNMKSIYPSTNVLLIT